MDMVIVKGDFNDRYGSNATWIAFSIQDTVINAIIEVIDWRIIATFSPAVNHPYHLPPFLTGTVILFHPRKGEGWNSSKWTSLTIL